MNKVHLIGRVVRKPEVRYTADGKGIARYTLAVSRKYKNGKQDADFINCIAFNKNAQFAEKYLERGMKICISGRIQTGSFTKDDGTKVSVVEVVVEDNEFVESKSANKQSQQAENQQPQQATPEQPWMTVPDGIGDSLPFV